MTASASGDSRSRVRSFLARICDTSDLADGDDLFARGLLNSLHAVQLVAFVEKTLDARIPDDDLDIRNFRSVDAIVAFLGRRGADAPP
jgi:acyl carrier protein